MSETTTQFEGEYKDHTGRQFMARINDANSYELEYVDGEMQVIDAQEFHDSTQAWIEPTDGRIL